MLYRVNHPPLPSDTRFSSYGGPKLGFDIFLTITVCVYIRAQNYFRTECTSSRGTFLIKTVRSSKVIQGRLWAKNYPLMLIFATTSIDEVWHGWYIWTRCEWSRGRFFKITVIWSKVTKGQIWVKLCFFFAITGPAVTCIVSLAIWIFVAIFRSQMVFRSKLLMGWPLCDLRVQSY